MKHSFESVSRRDVLEELEEKLNKRDFEAVKSVINEVGVDLYMKVVLGTKFIRMSESTYFRKLRLQAEKRYEITYRTYPDISKLIVSKLLSKFVDNYLENLQEGILSRIKRLRPCIREWTGKSSDIIRNFIDRECPYFQVEKLSNYVGEDYFKFTFKGQDMFVESA